MDVNKATKSIKAAFAWSCGTTEEKPPAGWNRDIKDMPNLALIVKLFIKSEQISGEQLEVFYWWMGVTLGLVPRDVK